MEDHHTQDFPFLRLRYLSPLTMLKNKEEIYQVATISAGDEEIGAKIAEALDDKDRVVTVE